MVGVKQAERERSGAVATGEPPTGCTHEADVQPVNSVDTYRNVPYTF